MPQVFYTDGTSSREVEDDCEMCEAAKCNVGADDAEWGCDYCRNDGKLNANNCCPECDAEYQDDGVPVEVGPA